MGLTERKLCPNSDVRDGAGERLVAVGLNPAAMTEADPTPPDGAAWFALTVKHQHERQIAAALRSKGLEELLPLYRTRRRWSDRVKAVDLPLFPNYVFCHFRFEDRLAVLGTPGVFSIVGFGGKPTPVSDQEIASIQAILASGLPVEPWPHLKAGDIVLVEDGPLRGLEGVLLQSKDATRVVVSVELLQRSIAVEIEREALALLRRPCAKAAGATARCGNGNLSWRF